MNEEAKETCPSPGAAPKKLSFLNKYLTAWIFAAMALGIIIGIYVPGLASVLNSLSIGTTSIPIAIGLIFMMYPPLARVKYEELGQIAKQPNAKRMFSISLFLNYVVGPFLMFALAWIFLPDQPEYRIGLILIGIARCIAMVLVWNQLADGDCEYAAILVALNSVFQVIMYSFYAYFLISVLSNVVSPGSGMAVSISIASVAVSVIIYLGIPFFSGVLSRYLLRPRMGAERYDGKFMSVAGKVSLLALLFTIVVMFSLRAQSVVGSPLDIISIAIPLLVYFAIMFLLSFWLSMRFRFDYAHAATQSFTAASNNFELAIAVAVGVFGIGSAVAFTAVIGPLVEVPVMISLVNLALYFRRRYYDENGELKNISKDKKEEGTI